MKQTFLFITFAIMFTACHTTEKNNSISSISNKDVQTAIGRIMQAQPAADTELVSKGVEQTAQFWEAEDGTPAEFIDFCTENYVADPAGREILFRKIQTDLEILMGNYNKMSVALKMPIHVTGSDITPIDEAFGAYEPSAHFAEDMFASKIAFIVKLNFPFYNLQEKNEHGKTWNRQEWAYARLGDVFISRVPAEITQEIASMLTDADNYISNYNIVMDKLRTENGEQLFPDGMKLIAHWGLRDELKSDYADKTRGTEKQEMIYCVMKHIVNQTIPEQVINNGSYEWKPVSNRIFKNGQEEKIRQEPGTRYQKLLNQFHAQRKADKYNPAYNTYILRAFDQQMEVSYDEIEQLFTQLLSSPQVAETAAIIRERLGRELRPYDIWYDGFKTRSNIPEEQLSVQTRKLYPDTEAFAAALPGILQKMGFSKKKAAFICNHVAVDASRGAGHAWGALMRDDKARLRTRVNADGMDYKGYNIAVHEFGHNVEQTISLHDVDNYIMCGIPNTGFTEALAFVFQKRDLELLGYDGNAPEKSQMTNLDIFWGCYEIMGVSLVDMRTWKWLYENPQATVTDLKQAVIRNAQEIWNMYYAPILGEKDSPILAVYSHMIDYPLYLPNYPYGHLIEFQLEKQFADKNIGEEIQRIYPAGRLTPDYWMLQATGQTVSVEPMLEAVSRK